MSWLEEPDFDLVSCYRQFLNQRGHFEYQYFDTHHELYVHAKEGSGNKGLGCCALRDHEDGPCPKTGEQSSNTSSSSAPLPGEGLEWDDIPELDALSMDDDEFFEISPEEQMEFDDLPSLEILSDSDDSDNEEEDLSNSWSATFKKTDSELIEQIKTVLTQCRPFPGDGQPVDPSYFEGEA